MTYRAGKTIVLNIDKISRTKYQKQQHYTFLSKCCQGENFNHGFYF